MPKMKTSSGARKRFKKTASGKLMRKHAYKNHILTKKSKKRKRALGHFSEVNPRDAQRIMVLVG